VWSTRMVRTTDIMALVVLSVASQVSSKRVTVAMIRDWRGVDHVVWETHPHFGVNQSCRTEAVVCSLHEAVLCSQDLKGGLFTARKGDRARSQKELGDLATLVYGQMAPTATRGSLRVTIARVGHPWQSKSDHRASGPPVAVTLRVTIARVPTRVVANR
jgi:hypothetical protein